MTHAVHPAFLWFLVHKDECSARCHIRAATYRDALEDRESLAAFVNALPNDWATHWPRELLNSQVASTTFATVKNELYASGFNYLSDNSQTDRAGRWVNQSYQELCSLAPWPFLKTSTTSTSPVSLPTLGRVIYVRDTTTNFKLVEADFDLLTDLQPNLAVTGTAGWYYIDYTTGAPALTAFPVTTNSLQVVYYQNPTPLSSDADVLVVPDQFVDVVVLGAMRRGYLDGTDTAQQYQMVKAEWSDRIEFMRTQLLPRPSYQEISIWPSSSTDW